MNDFSHKPESQLQEDPDDLLEISLDQPPVAEVGAPAQNGDGSPKTEQVAEPLPSTQSLSDQEEQTVTKEADVAPEVPRTWAPPVPALEHTPESPSDSTRDHPVESPEPPPPGAQLSSAEDEHGESWVAVLLKETVETIVLAVVIFLLIRVGIQNYRIEGSSMEPNFHNGEYLLVNKLAYRLGEYQRGDVIVFHYPGDPSKDYIKRVIGLPGDTVEIRDQVLYVNGIPIDEPYDTMPMSSFPAGPTVVEPNHLYVLGDNRPASSDTRDWGLLSEDLVIGKAWLAIYPFNQFGLVDHPELHFDPAMAQGP